MNVYKRGMARGLKISESPTIEQMAEQLGVTPQYLILRHMVSTLTAGAELRCSANDIKALCGAGKLKYCVNESGNIYLHPIPYRALLADVEAGRCTVDSVIQQHLLGVANRIDTALFEGVQP